MPNSDTESLPFDETTLPDCWTLWRCIGCGAMGNLEPCIAKCDFRKLEIVGAQEYAQLLHDFLTMREHAAALAVVVAALSALDVGHGDLETAYRRLQLRAREALTAAAPILNAPPNDEKGDIGQATVWLCATCGQVEAPQNCLGVCIRRNGDYLAASDYQALASRATELHQKLRMLAALVRQIAWVAPRVGQLENTWLAFQDKARQLLATSQIAGQTGTGDKAHGATDTGQNLVGGTCL
ncbi:MAG: hypothetical protein KGQ46_03145 [Hyphomicrobiales bacterium]|nr:hypothetical protein [Hyphomicrobiales bacterium]MDE2115955.1 hypothetical protein [Hyphomicrobiales bacterium]